MRGNTLSMGGMGNMQCISRKPSQKRLSFCLTKPFKYSSAELRMLLQPLSLFPKKYFNQETKKNAGDYKNYHNKHGLVECIGKQLQWQQDIQDLTPEQQQELIAVLVQGVNKIEPYVEEQIHNSSLSESLQRKIGSALHNLVLQICEKLFLFYCDKARVLTARGIFSGYANICRLRTQLTNDAGKILTVQVIKRLFLSMKDSTMDSFEITEDGIRIFPKRPDSGRSTEISEVIKRMPSIDLKGLLPACLYTFSQANKQAQSQVAQSPTHRSLADDRTRGSGSGLRYFSLIRRCHSLPNMSYGETLWEELDLELPKLPRCASLENMHFTGHITMFEWETEEERKKFSMEKNAKKKSKINDDLLMLLKNRTDDSDAESVISDDMPPLIKAVPQDEKRKRAREKLDKQIRELIEKEKEFQEQASIDLVEPIFDQPAVVAAKLSAGTAEVRMADVLVSKRSKFVAHHLTSKPPLYNDIVGEIDPDIMKQLDLPLFEEQRLNDVYNQFLESLEENEKYFDPDVIFKDVPKGLEIYSERLTLNKSLCQFEEPPWCEQNYHDWLLQPQRTRVLTDATRIYPRLIDLSPINEDDNLDMIYWKKWWKTVVTTEDYLKYLAMTDSDYLATVFHIFEEEEKISETEEKPVQDEAAASVAPEWKMAAKGEEDEEWEEAAQNQIDVPSFQERLDKMWDALQMPEDERIGLAIKYGTSTDINKFITKLDSWEKATELITQRETLMASLMTFENEASDPNRFFLRGPGYANNRLQEAKIRSTLYNKIERLDKKIEKIVNSIWKKYGEIVTFQGRSYLEKMKSDRIEMLYWLQEVRKMNALHYESKKLHTQLPAMSFRQLVLTEAYITK